MKSRLILITTAAIAAFILSVPASFAGKKSAYDEALAQIEKETGLKQVVIPDTTNQYLGKNHRGYDVLYSAQAGNVWGRYAARLTMGEIGREVGGILGFLTGQHEHLGGHVTGSPMDRLLSKLIGQPLTIMIVLTHKKPSAPRLDILSGYAVVGPEDKLAARDKVGSNAGKIYSDDAAFAAAVAGNKALMKRMKNLRCQYIRVDAQTVTFLWSGSETDYSGMIMDHGGYYKMLNALMDDLADIAEAIPAAPAAPAASAAPAGTPPAAPAKPAEHPKP